MSYSYNALDIGTKFGTKTSQVVRFPARISKKTDSSASKQKSPRKKRSSRFKGVSFDKATQKWLGKSKADPITGKFHKKRFRNEEEAFKWVSQINLELEERHRLTRDLDHTERLEAIESIIQLEKVGLYSRGILSKAVQEYIRRNPETQPTTLKELFLGWLDHKKVIKRCKTNTISTAKCHVQGFVELHAQTPINAITRDDCKHFIFEGGPDSSRRHRFSNLRDLFNFAQKEGRISPDPDAHPLWNLDRPEYRKIDEDDEFKIPWPIKDFEKLLRFSVANEDDFQCTAYLLLGAYAGIRTSELLKLRFIDINERKVSGIDIDRGIISIPRSVAKTKAKRNFRMHHELQAALGALRDRPRAPVKKYCCARPRPTDLGSKVVLNTAARLKRFRTVLHLPLENGGAGLPIFSHGGRQMRDILGKEHITSPSAWIPNGLRTSFASYHYDAYKDKKLTSSILGHTDAMNVFDEHYRMIVTDGDGEAFFKVARRVFTEFGYHFV